MSAQLKIETMQVAEVKQGLDRLVSRISRHETRILVEDHGEPVAGIVSVQDLRRLAQLDRDREQRFAAIEEFAAGFADQSAEEIERAVARAIAEVRGEEREVAATG